MHCSKCSVELVLDVSYKRKKEAELHAGRMGDAEEDSLPVNVTSADLDVAAVRTCVHTWVGGWGGGGFCRWVGG
jgi:hypothetical protein